MPATDLCYLGLVEVGQQIHAKKLSPVEVTRAMLDRIERLDGKLKSYAYVMADSALAEAAVAEKEIAAGKIKGPLHGVPVAIKDLCWVKGAPAAHGMTIHREFRPNEDATVVARLKDAGAIILGKLQQTEGAYADHHPKIDPPKNPWNAELWPGASSSGSGSATAAGPLLRIARNRYRRIDQVSFGGQRHHGAEAELGTGQPLRRVRTRGNAGSYRPDGAQRGRLRCNTRRDRGPGSQGYHLGAAARAGLSRGTAGRSARRDDRRRSALDQRRHR